MKSIIRYFAAMYLAFAVAAAGQGWKNEVISTDEALCKSITKALLFNENILVSTEKNEILLISPGGAILNRTGGYGTGRESYSKLSDIAVFSGMNIYGVDYDRTKILNYDRYLNFKGIFTSNPNWAVDNQFLQPLKLQIAQTGEWFLIDYAEQKLLKFDIRGQPLFSRYFALGGDEHYFQDLRLLEINPQLRHLYLYDAYLQKIYILDYWGNYVGARGDVSGEIIIFSLNGSAFYYADGSVIRIEGKMEAEKLQKALISAIPGEIRSISGGRASGVIVVAGEKILMRIYVD